MKNDLIKSVYDLEEKSEGIGRRDFIKKAGIAGLALAGLGSLGGCAHVDRTKYDYDAITRKYEKNPIQIHSLDDFALSGEELGEMRFSKGLERNRIPSMAENPLKGKGNSYPLQERKVDAPLCEEWLLSENVGQNWSPWYTISIFARKFKSKEESKLTEEKLKNMDQLEIEYIEKMLKYGFQTKHKISFNIFSKHPFIVEFVTGGLIYSGRGWEHAKRTLLYQKKRDLNLIRGNFDYIRILNKNF